MGWRHASRCPAHADTSSTCGRAQTRNQPQMQAVVQLLVQVQGRSASASIASVIPGGLVIKSFWRRYSKTSGGTTSGTLEYWGIFFFGFGFGETTTTCCGPGHIGASGFTLRGGGGSSPNLQSIVPRVVQREVVGS